MQSRLDAYRSLWNTRGLVLTLFTWTSFTSLSPTIAATRSLEQQLHMVSERADSTQPAKAEPRFRKISARKLPLEMLEEFRKDYPAAVELQWQYSSNEKHLNPGPDSKIYRVQGYNLGQYFTATYRNYRRYRYAVLEKCDDLATESKSAWQIAYPDWTCLAFSRITTNGTSLQTRILTTQNHRRQTQILVIDSDGKVRAIEAPTQWKRMSYRKIKIESLRLQLLTNYP